MYHTRVGTAQAETGEDVQITVQHVNISPEVAEKLFAEGIEIGDWGWKHKQWICNLGELSQIQAAARFYYGWSGGSETIQHIDNDKFIYNAWYTC